MDTELRKALKRALKLFHWLMSQDTQHPLQDQVLTDWSAAHWKLNQSSKKAQTYCQSLETKLEPR